MVEMQKSKLELDKWSMSDERAFMENLLCSRFNFFLVFFGLIIAGAVSTSDARFFKIILSLGSVISIPFALTIARAQRKLDIALEKHLFSENYKSYWGKHPAKVLDDECDGRSMRRWIGYWIPFSCCLALVLGAILALSNCLIPLSKG